MDKFFLGDNKVYDISPSQSGINANVAVVGATGSGKTESTVVPMLLNNDERSVVVPVSKFRVIKETAGALVEHGYDIKILDLAGDRSNTGYNPFVYLKSESNYKEFARTILEEEADYKEDKYWQNAASSVLSALLSLLGLNASYESPDKFPDLRDFKDLCSVFSIKEGKDTVTTTLDGLFDFVKEEYPDHFATMNWRNMTGLAAKTASSIYTVFDTGIQKLLLDEVINLSMLDTFDFRDLGRKKTALFIITSATNRYIDSYVNIIYKTIIDELMNEAESRDTGSLEIPVQLIFDDFACGTIIPDFDKYISVFRAAGISSMILLQSDTQLYSIYGNYKAVTILDNCDSYVYLGGNDWGTCRHIAEKVNKPPQQILQMPTDSVIIMRRGEKPVITRRYQTYEDPNYIHFAGRR